LVVGTTTVTRRQRPRSSKKPASTFAPLNATKNFPARARNKLRDSQGTPPNWLWEVGQWFIPLGQAAQLVDKIPEEAPSVERDWTVGALHGKDASTPASLRSTRARQSIDLINPGTPPPSH